MPPDPPRNISRRTLLRTGAALVLLLAGPAAGAAPSVPEGRLANPGYVLGVFPYMPPLALDRIFAPIVGALSQALERPVHLRTNTSFEAFSGDLSLGSYDLAFMHPFLYITAAHYGYVPLVRVDQPLEMVFLTRTDSGLTRLGDLAGRTLALPGALAAVSEIARLALAGQGLRPGIDVQLQHYQSKMSCVQALVAGDVAACGLPTFALAQMELGLRQDLRVFDRRELPVGLVIAAHPRLDTRERQRIQATITAWSASDQGQRILGEAGWRRFVPARDSDYDIVRLMQARPHKLAQRP